VGGIFTTLLSTKSIQETITGKPSPGEPASVEIFVLSVFFIALSIIAPFFYNAVGPEARPRVNTSEPAKKIQGYVWSFLVACALTLWGASGQIATLVTVLYNLAKPGSPHNFLFYVFAALLAVAFLMIWPYAQKSIRGTIEDFTPKTEETQSVIKDAVTSEAAERRVVPQFAPSSPSSWSVL
jgi:hypothetical protein